MIKLIIFKFEFVNFNNIKYSPYIFSIQISQFITFDIVFTFYNIRSLKW